MNNQGKKYDGQGAVHPQGQQASAHQQPAPQQPHGQIQDAAQDPGYQKSSHVQDAQQQYAPIQGGEQPREQQYPPGGSHAYADPQHGGQQASSHQVFGIQRYSQQMEGQSQRDYHQSYAQNEQYGYQGQNYSAARGAQYGQDPTNQKYNRDGAQPPMPHQYAHPEGPKPYGPGQEGQVPSGSYPHPQSGYYMQPEAHYRGQQYAGYAPPPQYRPSDVMNYEQNTTNRMQYMQQQRYPSSYQRGMEQQYASGQPQGANQPYDPNYASYNQQQQYPAPMQRAMSFGPQAHEQMPPPLAGQSQSAQPPGQYPQQMQPGPSKSQQQQRQQQIMPLVFGQFSTSHLQSAQYNTDVIPDPEYLDHIEAHQAKFDVEMLKQLLKQVGLSTPDERVYKMISIMLEKKMCQILSEVQAMQAQSQQAKEPSSVHAKIQQLKQENQGGLYQTDQQLRAFIKQQQADSQNDKRVLHFEDLRNALCEFGIQVRRPPFLEDQQQNKYSVQMPQTVSNIARAPPSSTQAQDAPSKVHQDEAKESETMNKD